MPKFERRMRNVHKRSNRNDGKPCKVYQKISEYTAAYCGNREDNRYQSHGRVILTHARALINTRAC